MKKLLSGLIFAPSFIANTVNAQSIDPAGSGPIVNAAKWVQGTLMGNVATTVAVIAVAMVGFMMLTGRMNWKFGATVVFGCFILFGSVAIVSGIQQAAGH